VIYITVDGSSDDLDLPIKQCFQDNVFCKRHNLSSINSINWARIMVQTVHYTYAYLQVHCILTINTGATAIVFGRWGSPWLNGLSITLKTIRSFTSSRHTCRLEPCTRTTCTWMCESVARLLVEDRWFFSGNVWVLFPTSILAYNCKIVECSGKRKTKSRQSSFQLKENGCW
jgi:hypothetical protein